MSGSPTAERTEGREIGSAHTAGRMKGLLSGGAPSDSYEASIGSVARRRGLEPAVPALPSLQDNIRTAARDQVAASVGNTDLESRLSGCKPFEPKMLS